MKKLIATCLICLLGLSAESRVVLPALFTDHMVLQRNKPIIIWGKADVEKEIKVSFAGISKTAYVEDGKWLVDFEPMAAGGPYELVISASSTQVVKDIMVGDVFVCGGQSNMEWPMSRVNNAEQELQDANYPSIRLFTVQREIADHKMDDLAAGAWSLANAETAADFSAIGFLTARNLFKSYGVPIGLIDNSWGGTNIMGWMSEEAFGSNEKYAKMIAEFKSEHCGEMGLQEAIAEFGQRMEMSDKGLFQGWSEPGYDKSKWKMINAPGFWEGQGFPGKDGFFWMSKKFNLSAVPEDKPCMLGLARIDDSDMTYLNGLIIGTTERAPAQLRNYQFFSDHLLEGENEITIRIKDGGGNGGIQGSASDMYLTCENLDTIALAGKWSIEEGSKDLVPLSKTYGANTYPTNRYNAMVHPLTNFPIAAYLYYQGEADASQAKEYEWLFQNMIRSYRAEWQDNKLPFVLVQLANFRPVDSIPVESQWAELRAAQAAALRLPYTAMVSAIDVGEANDIHPRDKQTVAQRMEACLKRILYNEPIIYDGPKIERVVTNSFGTLVVFKGTGEGLDVRGNDQDVPGFVIETADGNLVKVAAKKQSRTALLIDYTRPFKALRYLWADNPGTVAIYNEAGFPAEPFRYEP